MGPDLCQKLDDRNAVTVPGILGNRQDLPATTVSENPAISDLCLVLEGG